HTIVNPLLLPQQHHHPILDPAAAPKAACRQPDLHGDQRRAISVCGIKLAERQKTSGRLFGVTGNCAACSKLIPAFEMVMRAKENVYHLDCFACQLCNQ
ncbi:hypothetical protein KUCAC02_006722, partial [Chaenocephalus aceratus]